MTSAPQLSDGLRASIARQLMTGHEDLDRLSGALETLFERIHVIAGTITAATLNADMLADAQRRATESDARELGDAVRDSLKRLRVATEEFRGVIRDGRFGAADDVAPAKVIDAELASVRERLPSASWRLTMAPDVPPACRIHRGAVGFASLIGHLLSNAADGRDDRAPGQVEVKVGFDPARVVLLLEIIDDGPGFPEELLQHGPQPFLTTKPGHSGLGLFECRTLARLCGGSVVLSNATSGGAVVHVRLSVAPPAAGWER